MPRERAHRLFEELTLDLARITPDYPVRVLCPLCLTPFAEESIDLADPDLTEDHIIPEALGGTLVTLTCKGCNNTHGHQVDVHLIQMLRSRDALEGFGTRPIKGRIEVAGMTVPTDIDWKVAANDTTTFRLRQFNPMIHEAIRKHMQEGQVESIRLNLDYGYIPLRAWIAVLRIAYLAMFRWLGYGFVLSPAACVVREIIADFGNAPEALDRIVGEARYASAEPPEPIQFVTVGDGKAVMVILTLRSDVKRHYATFMPSPELPADAVLNTLVEVAETCFVGG